MNPKGRVEEREYWCQVKGVSNQGRENNNWRTCHKCCYTCRDSCSSPTCWKSLVFCCWRVTPLEYIFAKLDEATANRLSHERRVQYWEKIGHRENDGTWEGQAIANFRKRFGEDFGKERT